MLDRMELVNAGRRTLHAVCLACGRTVHAVVVGELPPRARLVPQHVSDPNSPGGRHAPEVWVGVERIR